MFPAGRSHPRGHRGSRSSLLSALSSPTVPQQPHCAERCVSLLVWSSMGFNTTQVNNSKVISGGEGEVKTSHYSPELSCSPPLCPFPTRFLTTSVWRGWGLLLIPVVALFPFSLFPWCPFFPLSLYLQQCFHDIFLFRLIFKKKF